MSDPIDKLSTELYAIVHGFSPLIGYEPLKAMPPHVQAGWRRLAKCVNEVTGASTLRYAAKRYGPSAEEIERMSRND